MLLSVTPIAQQTSPRTELPPKLLASYLTASIPKNEHLQKRKRNHDATNELQISHKTALWQLINGQRDN